MYALLFSATGLSDADISVLFLIWSGVGIVAEVPMGALADRFSRRYALVAAGVAQAAGYALWTALPGFPGFAGGFVLWGLGGALASGALEALVYDGLIAAGAQRRYPTVLSWLRSAELLSQLPTAVAATLLFATGGYVLVGWVSVGTCLCAAALATRLPEAPRARDPSADSDLGYLATLRAGLIEAVRRPAVRGVVLAVALLGGIDAFEEYLALLAHEWGVPVLAVPFALLAIPMAGAAGAAIGGRYGGLRPALLGGILAGAAAVLAVSGALHRPAGLVGLAVFYGLYRLVLLIADARLQDRITGPARATVTSVAELGTEFVCLVVYAAWALGQVSGVAVVVMVTAVTVPFALRRPPPGG